ncbi:MAG TPA: hypothetical protein VH092_31660 [Urbifossiella sp.]|jgi:hypothetical protein|nr:hypothetical protein [Urbifossiella sp.]
MTATTSTPAPPRPAAGATTTAAALLAAARPFAPAVDGAGLVFDLDPPAGLVAALAVLHTGVRAQLAGRRWYGCGSNRRTAAPWLLDPAAPIPDGVTLLSVEGDQRWDRLDPFTRLDLPALFAR